MSVRSPARSSGPRPGLGAALTGLLWVSGLVVAPSPLESPAFSSSRLDVNTIGAVSVPTARNEPYTWIAPCPEYLLSPGTITFTVTDRGPGIPPEVKDKVFDWFESHANGSRHRGAGLGLSLVRSFVELHGGKVRVDSAVGKGTTVSCDFPIDQTAHRNAAE